MEGIQEFLLDSYLINTVVGAWFHINSVCQEGTIMQSDGEVVSDRFQPLANLPHMEIYVWLQVLRNVHDNPQLLWSES